MSLPEAKFAITAEDKTQKAFHSVKHGLGELSNHLAEAKLLLLEVAGITGFGALIEHSIEAGAEISKLSERLGASTEALSQYRHVAEMSHVPFEMLTKSWQMMEKNISAAAKNSGPAVKGLEELHLSAEKLNQLKPEEQFEILTEALSHVPNHADKVRLAFQMMGKSGVQMLQIMGGGTEKIHELREEADRMGLTLHEHAAHHMHEAAEAMKNIKEAGVGLGNALAVQLALAITKVATLLEKGVECVSHFAGALLKLAEIVAVGKILQVGLRTLPTVVAAVITSFQFATKAVATFVLAFQLSPIAAFNTALFGTSIAATAATGALGKLKIAGGILFAAFAGWEIGQWLQENFVEARIAGLAFVGAMLKGWEHVKYAAQIAWAAISSAWSTTIQKMQNAFGSFLQFVASGFSKIPGLTGKSDALSQYADSLKSNSSTIRDFQKNLDELSLSHKNSINTIDQHITALVAFQLGIGNAHKATHAHKHAIDEESMATEHATHALKNNHRAREIYNDLLQQGKRLTEEMRTPQEIYADHLKEINQLLLSGSINQETYNRALGKYQKDLNDATGVTKAFEDQKRAAEQNVREITGIFRSGLFAFMQDGFQGMVKSFENALSAMAADAAAAEIAKLLFGDIANSALKNDSGLLGQLLQNGFGTLFGFGGFRAAGGSVSSGQGYIVGEKGPELFLPRQSGSIVPNNKMAGSGHVIINNYIQTQDAESFKRSEGNLAAKMKMQLDIAGRRNL